jgi:hypothetical protein
MKLGPRPDAAERLPNALDSGIHSARTHCNRGFMAFRLARRTRTVMRMVPVWPESGFQGRAVRPPPTGPDPGGVARHAVMSLVEKFAHAAARNTTT